MFGFLWKRKHAFTIDSYFMLRRERNDSFISLPFDIRDTFYPLLKIGDRVQVTNYSVDNCILVLEYAYKQHDLNGHIYIYYQAGDIRFCMKEFRKFFNTNTKKLYITKIN
jgi:hypothetical protein